MNDCYVQGIYNNGTVSHEETVSGEDAAVRIATNLVNHPAFEGDFVRVISTDGELVWDSRSA